MVIKVEWEAIYDEGLASFLENDLSCFTPEDCKVS